MTQGRTIMAHYIIIFLFVGGFIGWTLFAYTLHKFLTSRKFEIEMLDHIIEDLKIVKNEIEEIKQSK